MSIASRKGLTPLLIGYFRSFHFFSLFVLAFLQSCTSGSFTVYDANNRVVPVRLISDYQFIISGHGHLLVPPFTSNILLLIHYFIFIHVTTNSAASNFTITIASFETPLFITSALFQRVELKESQLLRLKSDGSSLGTIVNYLSIYIPSIQQLVTMRILGFGSRGHLIPLQLPYEGSLSFRLSI